MRSVFILIFCFIFSVPAETCTTFGILLNQNRLIGKSYDWDMNQGLVYVNKRNMKKQALLFSTTDKPAQWVSKYASLTFNQFGLEFPNGGMNEAGLGVEIMWLTSSVYPAPDARETLNELQWIQFMLDNYASVEEMVLNADKFRVLKVAAPVHYMACDKIGTCATFEYIGGKLVMHSSAQMVTPVLTNNTYAESIDNLKKYVGFGGNSPIPAGVGSLDRFVRASAKVREVVDIPSAMRKQAFTILDSVRNPAVDGTVWQIVYDLVAGQVHFKTRDHQAIKTVDFGNFNGSCKSNVKYVDIETESEGNVTHEFIDFSTEKNQALISESIHGLEFFPGNKEVVISILSAYPSSTDCIEVQ